MRQLALNFGEAPSYAAADFVEGPSNRLALDWLGRPDGWTNGRLVLWGEAGCGKSHLLHIWAAARRAVIYQGDMLVPQGPVAVDDYELAADETALLHVLNRAAAAGQPVLLTGRAPPARHGFALADLASRLRASLAVRIEPPGEALLAAILTQLAASRQLSLSFQVRNYLLRHLPRTPAALREAVARLDRVAMAGGAGISRGLAAAVVRELTDASDAEMLLNRHSPAKNDLI
jgi:chromosomal replication initiation ATPase DnaA